MLQSGPSVPSESTELERIGNSLSSVLEDMNLVTSRLTQIGNKLASEPPSPTCDPIPAKAQGGMIFVLNQLVDKLYTIKNTQYEIVSKLEKII